MSPKIDQANQRSIRTTIAPDNTVLEISVLRIRNGVPKVRTYTPSPGLARWAAGLPIDDVFRPRGGRFVGCTILVHRGQ